MKGQPFMTPQVYISSDTRHYTTQQIFVQAVVGTNGNIHHKIDAKNCK